MNHMEFIGEKPPEQPQRTIVGEMERITEIARLAKELERATDPIEVKALLMDLNRKTRVK